MKKAEIKKGMNLARRVQDQLNNTRYEPKTKSNSFTIPVSGWTLENDKYTANVSVIGATAENYAEVFFDDNCSEIVSTAEISTEGETTADVIKLTAKNLPTDTISGTYYIFKGDSFTMKARVNVGQDSTFVGATSITSGVTGNVPAPLAGDQNKFLCGNGQWATIPSNLVINGDEVQAVTLQGGIDCSYNSSTKIANISVTGGGVQEVSVVGGALQASISAGKLFLQNADRSPKSDAGLTLSTQAVTLNAYQPVTITASHDGDGIVQIYSDRFVQSEQLNANQFKISPKYAGEGNIGFYLAETANYYGAAKNLHVHVSAENSKTAILMHFDDDTDWAKNEGYAQITNTTGSPAIDAQYGKFGKGISVSASTNFNTLFPLGGKDFSVSLWARSTLSFALSTNYGGTAYVFVQASTSAFALNLNGQSFNSNTYLLNSEMQHIAVVYRHDLGKVRLFQNGVKTLEVDVTFARVDINSAYFYWAGWASIMDELLVLDDMAQYWDNFTPPTEPC